MIENAYHGSVGGMARNTYGRVDQLEDRYLGMVEAPSSNLGTSTLNDFAPNLSGPCASTKPNPVAFVACSARPPETNYIDSVGR